MKTTAVALYISGSQARWCHIGDSRLYHYYNGELKDYTRDHSVCQVAVRMGEITRREIPGHPDRSKILRALGSERIEPELHPVVTLDKGFHAFLLCSDGLWERLQEDESRQSGTMAFRSAGSGREPQTHGCGQQYRRGPICHGGLGV